MKFVRAFVAGIALPATILPIGLCLFSAMGNDKLLTVPVIHSIPLFWGIWNVLYFAFFKNFLPRHLDTRLLITGAVLGLLVALYGVFGLHLPKLLGAPENFYYLPLLLVLILYAILWRFIVKPLNDLVGLQDA